MSDRATRTSPLALARITGVLYLIVMVCAGFAQGYVRAGLIVPGDAAATADKIAAAQGLFRFGFASDLVAFICDAAISVLLYVLLRPVSKTLSLLAAAFRLLAHPAVAAVNLLNHFAAVLLVGGASALSAFNAEQIQDLALFYLTLHRYGYLIGGAFFGVHCLFLGVLLFKSGYFPRILGVLLLVAGCGYLAESFGNFLVEGHELALAWVVALPAVAGELSLSLWLVIKGLRIQPWNRLAQESP